jgi:hypothetical protein
VASFNWAGKPKESYLRSVTLSVKYAPDMTEIRFHVFGVTFEASFKNAVLYRDSQCDLVAQKFLEAFASYGLKPKQITLNHRDQLFNYELSVSLFNGNATLKVSSEKLFMEFKNVIPPDDVGVVNDCVVKTFEHIPFKEITSTTISVNSHATMASGQEAMRYLQKNAKSDLGIIWAGTNANIRSTFWPQEIRITIEESLRYTNALFISWTTVHHASKLSGDVLLSLSKALMDSLEKFDLVEGKPQEKPPSN